MSYAQRQIDSRSRKNTGLELFLSVNPLPERLERVAREIAVELQSQLDQLAERWYARMTSQPELERWAVPELRRGGVENARRDIGRELAGLQEGRALPVSAPREVIDSARLAETSGLPLWACVQAYAVQWEAWSDAVEARPLERDERFTLLRAGSEYLFAYADRCARWVELEYTRARDRRLRSEEQVRMQLVRDLLEGKAVDSSQLAYGLDGWHLAVIAAGTEGERVLYELSTQLEAQLLCVAADTATWWGWLGANRKSLDEVDRQLQSLTLPAGVRLAIGEPGDGPAGFRRSHVQAQYAARISNRRNERTVLHSEVALVALATADFEQAKWFVSRELGPLAGDDRRARVLRDTLRAYFTAGQTGSSAAMALGVHERTVGNRLRAAERLTGRSIHSRRAELDTALRIHHLLHDTQPAVPDEMR
jgi:hypothetical protein